MVNGRVWVGKASRRDCIAGLVGICRGVVDLVGLLVGVPCPEGLLALDGLVLRPLSVYEVEVVQM
jgi:hypothetical protein